MKPITVDFLDFTARRQYTAITRNAVQPAVADSLYLHVPNRSSENPLQPERERVEGSTLPSDSSHTTKTSGVWEVNLCEDDDSEM